ncbi:MAG: hypothetical protein CBC48_11970 [bacterium TMED88]|nr:MAG: hypothetical protein CBC48_11970 [bacterium TMED88]
MEPSDVHVRFGVVLVVFVLSVYFLEQLASLVPLLVEMSISKLVTVFDDYLRRHALRNPCEGSEVTIGVMDGDDIPTGSLIILQPFLLGFDLIHYSSNILENGLDERRSTLQLLEIYALRIFAPDDRERFLRPLLLLLLDQDLSLLLDLPQPEIELGEAKVRSEILFFTVSLFLLVRVHQVAGSMQMKSKDGRDVSTLTASPPVHRFLEGVSIWVHGSQPSAFVSRPITPLVVLTRYRPLFPTHEATLPLLVERRHVLWRRMWTHPLLWCMTNACQNHRVEGHVVLSVRVDSGLVIYPSVLLFWISRVGLRLEILNIIVITDIFSRSHILIFI